MTKPAFTPWPWRVVGYADEDERDGAVAVVARDGFIVAEVLKWPQQDANARLIAAAPDMYEALRECPLPSTMGDVEEHYHRFYDWYNKHVTAAMSKAEGRS